MSHTCLLKGSCKVEGIKLSCCEEVNCIDIDFEKMKKLRILIVRNTRFSCGSISLPNQLKLLDWEGYPSESFPQGFYPEKIVALHLSRSRIKLVKPFQVQFPAVRYYASYLLLASLKFGII